METTWVLVISLCINDDPCLDLRLSEGLTYEECVVERGEWLESSYRYLLRNARLNYLSGARCEK